MSIRVDVSAIGDDELEMALRRLEGKDQRKVVVKALRAGAKNTARAIKSRLPVDSGDLKSAKIKPRAMKRSRRRIGLWIGLPTREELGIAADAKWYYPAAVEYGYTRKARAPVTVPPKPFLRPAFDESESRSFQLIKDEIGAGVERLWSK